MLELGINSNMGPAVFWHMGIGEGSMQESMDLRLVSAGDDVKLWDSRDLILTRQFNPHDQNVSAVCWASDNSFLASLSLHAEEVAITSMKNLEVSMLPCGSGCMCVDINETSRYLLTGGSNGIIAVWDLKARKVRKHFKDHKGPVTTARFNQGSTSMASGSETGEIILYNVVTGQGCKPLIAPNVQAIKQVQYSQGKKHMLGAVSDDGCLNLWDCNTRQMINSTPCHRAPATSLSFSPVNDIFLISVGLDKHIVCHDIQTNKIIKMISCDSPLTAVDTLGDGVTVVVGSTRGKIYQYDLRMGSVPVRVTEAHKSSVQGLRYQKEVDSSGNRSSTGSKQSRQRQLPASPPKSSAAITRTGGTDSVVTAHIGDGQRESGTGVDVFSPYRDGFQDQSSVDVSGPQPVSLTTSSIRETSVSAGGNYSGGVFSPMNDNTDSRISDGGHLSGFSRDQSWSNLGIHQSNYNAINTQNMSGPHVGQLTRDMSSGSHGNRLGVESQGEAVSDVHPTNHSATRSHVTFEPTPRENISGINLSPRQPSGTHQKQVAFSAEENDPYAFLTKDSPSSSASNSPGVRKSHGVTNQEQYGVSASPSLPSMHLDDSPGSVSGGAKGASSLQHYPTTPEGVNAESLVPNNITTRSVRKTEHRLETGRTGLAASRSEAGSKAGSVDVAVISDIVRNVVREELNDMKNELKKDLREEMIDSIRDELHKDIVLLHSEVVVKFQEHHDAMLRSMQFFSLNEDLLSEVERLKEEVKRLKRTY